MHFQSKYDRNSSTTKKSPYNYKHHIIGRDVCVSRSSAWCAGTRNLRLRHKDILLTHLVTAESRWNFHLCCCSTWQVQYMLRWVCFTTTITHRVYRLRQFCTGRIQCLALTQWTPSPYMLRTGDETHLSTIGNQVICCVVLKHAWKPSPFG